MERENGNEVTAIVEIIDGGPLKIEGPMILKDLKKDIYENRREVFLCRCGNSGKKPYCDTSHRK
jgi:3-phenylpropionate/trans-cinnamate dioxygenase ferredoxin subunit